MCGDFQEGIELAIGVPQPVSGQKSGPPDWFADFVEPTAKDYAFTAREAARDERIEALPLSTTARVYSLSSFEWLRDRSAALRAAADGVVVEALEIVAHDSVFIPAKIHRALGGRDRFEHDDETVEEDPIQNDWNGSAKVALISVGRSENAWQTIAGASSDAVATVLAEQLAAMRELLLLAFPRAMAFVRPGFDEPWRQWPEYTERGAWRPSAMVLVLLPATSPIRRVGRRWLWIVFVANRAVGRPILHR